MCKIDPSYEAEMDLRRRAVAETDPEQADRLISAADKIAKRRENQFLVAEILRRQRADRVVIRNA